MSELTLNGKQYSGKNIIVNDEGVFIDGEKVNDDTKNILHIVVEGTIESLQTNKSVSCQDVSGNVDAGGSVNCDDVHGSVCAGGSVNCDDVGGNVSAGGSVRHG